MRRLIAHVKPAPRIFKTQISVPKHSNGILHQNPPSKSRQFRNTFSITIRSNWQEYHYTSFIIIYLIIHHHNHNPFPHRGVLRFPSVVFPIHTRWVSQAEYRFLLPSFSSLQPARASLNISTQTNSDTFTPYTHSPSPTSSHRGLSSNTSHDNPPAQGSHILHSVPL